MWSNPAAEPGNQRVSYHNRACETSQAADTAVSVPYLDAILFVLGIRREDIEAADSEEGIERLSVPVDGLPPV